MVEPNKQASLVCTIRYLPLPNPAGEHNITAISGQILDISAQDVGTVDTASDWLIVYLDTVNNGHYK